VVFSLRLFHRYEQQKQQPKISLGRHQIVGPTIAVAEADVVRRIDKHSLYRTGRDLGKKLEAIFTVNTIGAYDYAPFCWKPKG